MQSPIQTARLLGLIGVVAGLVLALILLIGVTAARFGTTEWVAFLFVVVGAYAAYDVPANPRRAALAFIVAAMGTAVTSVAMLAAPFFIGAAYFAFVAQRTRVAASA
jgi:hypothetical protein